MDKIQVPSWEIIRSHRRAQEIIEIQGNHRKSQKVQKVIEILESLEKPRKSRKTQKIQKVQKPQKVQKTLENPRKSQPPQHPPTRLLPPTMGVCPFHDTPPCESKIKLSVIRILSLSFAPFWQYPLFLLHLNHVSAADRSACSAAYFDVVCHLLGEFYFLGLVEGHCAPNSYCSCSCEQEGIYHSRTLIVITLCFHGFYFFILFIFCFPF